MKVQIRPAIYGKKGVRYEAYQVIGKFSWWSGFKREYQQLYWEYRDEGAVPSDYDCWCFDGHRGEPSQRIFRSEKTVDALVKVIKDCYGNSVKFVTWRPEED